MKKAFRKITKVISITTTILLSNVLLAYSAFAEGGIGNAPSSVDTATYDTLVTLVFLGSTYRCTWINRYTRTDKNCARHW